MQKYTDQPRFFGERCPALTSQSAPWRVKPLVFEGKVLAIGPSPGYGSGGVQAYLLVKYYINQVCEGKYGKTEIVADHLLLDPDELKDLKVGDSDVRRRHEIKRYRFPLE